LRSHLSASLPEYMVPAAYVHLQSLPLTPNGKLDRKALPAPEAGAYAIRGYEAPQGETEEKLAQIWAEVLKLDQVGRHDNFFALGGHSLLAVRVIIRLQQIGISILTADLFKYPTIHSLAVSADFRAAKSDNTAIPIRTRGTKLPIFMTHDGTGELSYLFALAPHIDKDIPIYGLPSPLAEQVHLHTIEEMATRMLHMIRSVQPTGPYHIAGWSSGGFIAYEIAAQLIRENQDVRFLGLIDTHYYPEVTTLSNTQTSTFDDKNQLLTILQDQLNTLGYRGEAIDATSTESDFLTIVEEYREAPFFRNLFDDSTPEQIRTLLARFYSLQKAIIMYLPRRLPISLHVYTAAESSKAHPIVGWKLLASKEHFREIIIPGTHHSIMRSPNAELLGRAISLAISNLSDYHEIDITN
jgi:thioesterase domain-containing protein